MSDEETVRSIEENPYMQYFLGFDEFLSESPFSASLFVQWRKKLDNNTFNKCSDTLARVCLPEKFPSPQNNDNSIDNTTNDELLPPNCGELKLDATVADQYITYPNDLGLLNSGREKTERMIDVLFICCVMS